MSKNGGWTIVVREHSLSFDVYLLLNAAICDSTTAQKIDTRRLATAIVRQMDNSYQITYFKDVVERINVNSGLDNFHGINHSRIITKTVRVHCTVKYRIIKNIHQRYNTELLIDVRDKNRLVNKYGKADRIGGNNLYLNEVFVPNMINGADNNTIPHELGHTLGLYHVDDFATRFASPTESWNRSKRDSNSTNIMFSGDGGYIKDKTSTSVIPLQINLIIDNYRNGNLNLR